MKLLYHEMSQGPCTVLQDAFEHCSWGVLHGAHVEDSHKETMRADRSVWCLITRWYEIITLIKVILGLN